MPFRPGVLQARRRAGAANTALQRRPTHTSQSPVPNLWSACRPACHEAAPVPRTAPQSWLCAKSRTKSRGALMAVAAPPSPLTAAMEAGRVWYLSDSLFY